MKKEIFIIDGNIFNNKELELYIYKTLEKNPKLLKIEKYEYKKFYKVYFDVDLLKLFNKLLYRIKNLIFYSFISTSSTDEIIFPFDLWFSVLTYYFYYSLININEKECSIALCHYFDGWNILLFSLRHSHVVSINPKRRFNNWMQSFISLYILIYLFFLLLLLLLCVYIICIKLFPSLILLFSSYYIFFYLILFLLFYVFAS